jgi:hypothetical protein
MLFPWNNKGDEDSLVNDTLASRMDLINNEIGFRIGREARELGLTGDEAREYIIEETIKAIENVHTSVDVDDVPPDTAVIRFNHGLETPEDTNPNWRENITNYAKYAWPIPDEQPFEGVTLNDDKSVPNFAKGTNLTNSA